MSQSKYFLEQPMLKSADITVAFHKYIRSWSLKIHFLHQPFVADVNTKLVLSFSEVTIDLLLRFASSPLPHAVPVLRSTCHGQRCF